MQDPTPEHLARYRQGMIYHRGVPVAVCPVASVERDRLQLRCGPLRFDRQALLSVSLTRDGDPFEAGVQVTGRVEAEDRDLLTLRLTAVADQSA